MATVRQSGGDYSSLATALAAGEAVVDIDQAWTVADTTPAAFTADCVITVSGAARHPGYIDYASNHYRLVVSTDHCLELSGAFSATVDGLCIEQAGANSSDECFRCRPGTADTVDIIDTIMHCSTNTSSQDCLYTGANMAIGTINATQCCFAGAGRGGVHIQNNYQAATYDATINLNSCVSYDNGTTAGSGQGAQGGGIYASGLSTPGGTPPTFVVNVQNCSLIGNDATANAFDIAEDVARFNFPLWNISNSMDSDNSIANVIDNGTGNFASRTPTDSDTPGAGNWIIFENITTEPYNLSLKDNAENDAQDAHANALAHGLTIPALDITGLTARPQNTNYDIGPFEITAGGGGAIDLTIADLEVSPELDNLAIARGRSITVQDLSVGPELDNLIVSPAKLINVDDLEVGPELDNLAITRRRTITVAGLEVGPELDNVATNKQANLNVADLEVGPDLDNLIVGISTGIVLNIQGVEITPEFDNVEIARDIALVPADLEVGPELDNVAVGKETTLVVADSEVRPETDNVTVGISTGVLLNIADLEVSTELTGDLGISRARNIAIAGIEVGTELDNVAIGLGKTLVIQDVMVQPEMNNLSISIPGSQVFGSTNNVMLLTNESQIMSIT